MKQILSILLCILVFFLPIQSILGVFAVNKLGLPVGILLWKECVEALVMSIMVFDISRNLRDKNILAVFKGAWIILVTVIISIFIILRSQNSVSILNIFYGFRFELFWVFFLSIFYTWFQLTNLETIEYLKQRVSRSLYYGFVPVLIVSYATLIFGQEKVLGFFGFGITNTKLLSYIPVSQVVDGGGWNNLLRLSGSFTTPNHFAGYLLLIFGFFLYRTTIERSKSKKIIFGFATFNIIVFIVLSFARFAWLGLITWFVVLATYYFVKNKLIRRILFILAFILPVLIGTVAINLPEQYLQKSLPSFIAKPSSTTFHARRTFAALTVLGTHPRELWVGYGLGASGPAAKEQYTVVSQNPLYKENIETALKYYLRPEEILIPENWFIQLVLNGGLVYALLYSIVVLFPLYRIIKRLILVQNSTNIFDTYILLGLFSIVIGNLFLHLWENQTIAVYYTLLILFMYKTHKGSYK
jgi:hypothetical protein